MYLVTIFWTQRPLTSHFITAENESQAIMAAVSQGRKSNSELYDHVKSKAVRLEV